MELLDLKNGQTSQGKESNYYRLIEELHKHLMRDYSYHTVSSIINAFEKKCEFSLVGNYVNADEPDKTVNLILEPIS